MSGEIDAISRSQTIIVQPTSGSVSIINGGPIGPRGLTGATGPTGPIGLPGEPVTTFLDIPMPIVLFSSLAPGPDFIWTEIEIDCYAGLFIRFTLLAESVSNFAYLITSKPSGAGEQMFAAAGFPSNEVKMSWPWWYNNEDIPRDTKMYIGIKNTGTVNSKFTLTDLRGYSLEV